MNNYYPQESPIEIRSSDRYSRIGSIICQQEPCVRDEAQTARDIGAPLTSLIESLLTSPPDDVPDTNTDPLGHLFTGKEYMLRAKAKLLYDELSARHQLRDRTVSMLNEQQCKLQSEIWKLERWVPGIKLIEDQKSRLEQELLRLEKDKHDEATKSWKDTTGVKEDLIETVRELRKVQGHQALLAEPVTATQPTSHYTEGLLY